MILVFQNVSKPFCSNYILNYYNEKILFPDSVADGGAPTVIGTTVLDVALVRYQQSPGEGWLRQKGDANTYRYGQAAVSIPVTFKDSSVLLVSPATEWWQVQSSALPQLPGDLYGMALPVAFIKTITQRWSGMVMGIARWNGTGGFGFDEKVQLGGAVLLSHKKSTILTYKMGLYYNREAFGHFVMPLLGVDWRPTPRTRLFGVLPGQAVLEKKASKSFYYGLSFRATTTSYRFPSPFQVPCFIRIENNTLQVFADVYLTNNLVLNAEGGHSFFRRFRIGQEAAAQKYEVQEKFNDGLLFRLGLFYRVRFDRDQ